MSNKSKAIEMLMNNELEEVKICGACGEYYEAKEADTEGFHSEKSCSVRADEAELKEVFRSFGEYLNSIEPLTIGDLRKMIEGLSDDTQILVGLPDDFNPNRDWFNVSHKSYRPDVDDEYSAFTLFLKDNYDSRQF